MAQAGQNAALGEEELAKARGQKPGEMDRADHPACGVNRVVDQQRGVIELLMPDGVTPRKKFALCGFASSTREMAPFNEPDWAIIAMNQLYRHLPRRADALFEIHKVWNTAVVPGTDHAAWLRNCGIPVIMAETEPDLPTSVKFPLDRLIGKFSDYFTSTVSYMVSFFIDHIDREVEKALKDLPPTNPADTLALVRSLYSEYTIGIFGIDLVVGEEYFWQKPCAEYHIGHALGRGITVMIPPQSALLVQRYRYGYQMEPSDLLTDKDLANRRDAIIAEQQKHMQAAAELTGAVKELNLLTEMYQLRERGAKVG